MFKFFVLYPDFFIGIGIVIFFLFIPLVFFAVRYLKKTSASQIYLKICGSTWLITFIGTSLMGLGMYFESLQNIPVNRIEYGSGSFLLFVVVCPGVFAIISTVVMGVSIWSEHVKQLAAEEKQRH